MPIDTKILRNGKRVPVVAFFGTKGGVGKTTISRKFAEQVTLAPGGPNVLLVDGDVYHRGMTVEMTKDTPVTCKTVHDYIASRNASEVEAARMTGVVAGHREGAGELFFIPASTEEAVEVFQKSATIGAEPLLQILHEVVSRAVEQYDCQCVVVDCGPIIDPYTAGAATLADRGFIIGQNEPISFSSLKTYAGQIRGFYPEFSTAKMKIIINKVRAWEMLEQRKQTEDIFAAIPFTMDIVDVGEGLAAANEMQLVMFEQHITQIIEKVFRGDHPELIPAPDSLLPPQWQGLMQNAEALEHAPKLQRLAWLRLLLPLGLLVLLIGGVLLYSATQERGRREREAQTAQLTTALTETLAKASAEQRPKLDEALAKAKAVTAERPETFAAAQAAAQAAGLSTLPALPPLESKAEDVGIIVLLAGLVVGAVGFFCARSRNHFLAAIRGLRRGGVPWLMNELKSRRSARQTFDKLLKMVQP